MKNSTLLHIPHASTIIPKEYSSSFCPEKLLHELDVMTDWFCDEIFDCDRDKIVFPISRLICDVERFKEDKDEIMAKIGMGAVYTNTSDKSCLRTISEDEKQEILFHYYDVHHATFTKAVKQKLDMFDHCLIIDCHSFYPDPLPYELDKDKNRPDFCIGTSGYHTPKILADNLVKFLSSRDYSVKVNSPFAGTIVPMKYYENDKRVQSVMIEINRKLYMDMPRIKSAKFSEICSVLKMCIEIAENSINV